LQFSLQLSRKATDTVKAGQAVPEWEGRREWARIEESESLPVNQMVVRIRVAVMRQIIRMEARMQALKEHVYSVKTSSEPIEY